MQTNAYYRWRYYALYFQDDFKATSKLTLNLGLRWDVETPRTEKYDRQGSFDPFIQGTVNGQPVHGAFVFSGTQGLGRGLWPTNFTGFQPRVGIAYAAKPWMTWRASYSLIRAPITGAGLDIFPDLNVNAGKISSSDRTGGVNPGPINLITNPIGPLPASRELPRDPIFFMNDTNSFDFAYIPQNSSMPYVQKWNAGMQFLLAKDFSVEVGYDAAKGTHLFTNRIPFHVVRPEATAPWVTKGADFNTSSESNNLLRITNSNGQVIRGKLIDVLRPYPNWFNKRFNTLYDRSGNSIYHALIFGFQRRFAAGLTFQGSYSWAKSIDDSGSSNLQTGEVADVFGLVLAQDLDRRSQRSLSTYDIPHKFNVAYSYELPIGRGKLLGGNAGPWLNRLIGGFNISGIYRLQSGYPAVAYLGSDGWFQSVGGGSGLDGLTLRPDRVPGVDGISPTWREDPFRTGYYNLDAFAVPGSDGNPRLGNSSPTLPDVRSPYLNAWDASVFKNINLDADGRRYLQLRVDILNVPNHPNLFINPNSRNGGLFSYDSKKRVFTPRATFTPIDPNNTAQFNNYAGRAFRLGARLYF